MKAATTPPSRTSEIARLRMSGPAVSAAAKRKNWPKASIEPISAVPRANSQKEETAIATVAIAAPAAPIVAPVTNPHRRPTRRM